MSTPAGHGFGLAFVLLLAIAGAVPGQAAYNKFGAGCPGSGPGKPIPRIDNTGLPALGKTFSIDLSGARAHAATALVFGLSDSSWRGQKLPWDMGVLGARGCALLASIDLIVSASTGAQGRATFGVPVPADKRLIGARLFNQILVGDPAANALGVAFSNGGAAILGLPNARPPAILGEIIDGTLRDVAASTTRVWLAQGRRLAVLDARTRARIPAEEVTYGRRLVAVEYDPAANLLHVASATQVDTFYRSAGKRVTWSLPNGEKQLQDLEDLPGTGRLVVLSTDKLRVLSHSKTGLVELGQARIPSSLLAGLRLQVHTLRSGRTVAYVIGVLTSSRARGMNGFVTFDLDPNGRWQPVAHKMFNPTTAYGSKATINHLQVISNAKAGTDRAYVACGMQKVGSSWSALVLELDVANPAVVPAVVRALHLNHGFPAWNVQKNPAGSGLWVASSNRLFRLNLPGPTVIGSTAVPFYDAGERDMAYVALPGGRAELWTATHHSVDYCVHHLSVEAAPNPRYLPRRLGKLWWISSSDGAVAVPGLRSVYLPTFGGLARYDITDPTRPVAAADSAKKAAYQPSGSNTEHVAYLRLSATHGYVVTVRGAGGFEAYAVDSADPNPAPPLTFTNPPSTRVYANGIATWSSGRERYVLVDVTDRSTNPNTYYLQAWQYTGSGSFRFAAQVRKSHAAIGRGLTHNVHARGSHAFVGGEGLFFVVDLSGLPARMTVTDTVLIPRQDGVRGIAATATHVFVGLDGNANGGAIESYTFDPVHGDVGGAANTPLDRITRLDIPGLQVDSRMRLNPVSNRIYACGKGGRLYEVDVSDPRNLVVLSTLDHAYEGESQDSRVYVIGGRTLVLYVKNNEGFALLDPDDGL